jgi:hypothetical protein
MVETRSPTSLVGTRDQALLLVGFAGAFRRSELVSLDVAFNAEQLRHVLRRAFDGRLDRFLQAWSTSACLSSALTISPS